MELRVPKRLAVAGTVALGLTLPQTSHAQVGPVPELTQMQRAWSAWQQSDSIRVINEGLRLESVDGQTTIGRVSRISCADNGCLGISVVKEIPATAFTLSPDLSQGTLDFVAHGDRVRTTWRSEGEPPTLVGASRGARVRNDATAMGTSFGRRLDLSRLKRAALAGGGSAALSQTEDPPLKVPSEIPRVEMAESSCWEPRSAERAFARGHNQERGTLGLRKLRLDPELSRVARRHTREMLSKDSLFHSSTLQLRNRVTGWTILGENVGVGDTPDSLLDAFMDSPLHRANVLHAAFRHVGFGTQRKNGRLWVTVIFEALANPDTTLRMPSCT